MAEKVYNRLEIRLAEKKDIKRIGELLEQVNRIHHDIRPDLFRLGRKYSERELEKIIEDKSTPVFVVTDRRYADRLLYDQASRDKGRSDQDGSKDHIHRRSLR